MGAATPFAGARILVVDDHEDNIELLRARLEARGYRVEAASDGQQALDVLARERAGGGEAGGAFVACLMDCQMPGASSAHLPVPMCQIGS